MEHHRVGSATHPENCRQESMYGSVRVCVRHHADLSPRLFSDFRDPARSEGWQVPNLPGRWGFPKIGDPQVTLW